MAFSAPPTWQTRRPLHASSDRGTLAVCLADTFAASVARGHVTDFGRYVPLDPDGRLSAPAPRTTQVAWRAPIDAAVSAILSAVGHDDVLSMYVRGSVASGSAFCDGRSDLDLVVLVRADLPAERERAVVHAVSRRVRAQFPSFVCGVDARFVTASWPTTRKSVRSLPRGIQVLLASYAVCVYSREGQKDAAAKFLRPLVPGFDLAIDIRSAQRLLLRAYERKDDTDGNMGDRLKALQWFCKRGLRAAAELASASQSVHCRDLVPCYKVAVSAFPEHAITFLNALEVSCACQENGFAGEGKASLVDVVGLEVALDLAEIVEDEYLRRMFPDASVASEPEIAPAPVLPPSNSPVAPQRILTSLANFASGLLMPNKTHDDNDQATRVFISDPLPQLSLTVTKGPIVVTTFPASSSKSSALCETCLTSVVEPTLFKGALAADTLYLNDSNSLVRDLCNHKHNSVQVRRSSSNTFTFCRATHPLIDSGQFTPPSRLQTMPSCEFFDHVSEHYARSGERLYMQTAVPYAEQLFRIPQNSPLITAQTERRWVSTSGSVSSLHYDASYSALAQCAGTKRMIFFPASQLPHLGIYPLGHPLHRRARVDLSRASSAVFSEFWRVAAHTAVEVVIQPGDVVCFPPFWAHYTESTSDSPRELCISHTFRYLFK